MLIPLLIDGLSFLVYLTFAIFGGKEQSGEPNAEIHPFLSIIIPVHNSEKTLGECLNSISKQNFSLSDLEVILINNGSSDASYAVYQEFLKSAPVFPLRYINLEQAGKSRALNAGIFMSKGDYIISLDSDTILMPDALAEILQKFASERNVVGITGAILINEKKMNIGDKKLLVLQLCEAFEYVESFYIARSFQSRFNTIFTMAGAFSAFRKVDLLNTYLYDISSVSEDTKLSFDLRFQRPGKNKMLMAEKAVALVEPISSMRELYGQRLRWQRGQLEVASYYQSRSAVPIWKVPFSFTARVLFADHTLAFPRLAWIFLIPVLLFYGYPIKLILGANIIIYLLYLAIDYLYIWIALSRLPRDYSEFIRKYLWAIIFLPFYRFIVYWFRLAGMINAVTAYGKWNSPDPFKQSWDGVQVLKARIKTFFSYSYWLKRFKKSF